MAVAPTSALTSAPPVALNAAPADNVIYIDIRVPADAEVWIEGQRMSQKGAVRYFESPPVNPGVEYVYHIRAYGQDVDEVRDATVHPGSKVAIDFTKRARETAPPPKPKAPPTPPQPKAGVDGV
jgi:uncharacterized protein (TIGR03000 family)